MVRTCAGSYVDGGHLWGENELFKNFNSCLAATSSKTARPAMAGRVQDRAYRPTAPPKRIHTIHVWNLFGAALAAGRCCLQTSDTDTAAGCCCWGQGAGARGGHGDIQLTEWMNFGADGFRSSKCESDDWLITA